MRKLFASCVCVALLVSLCGCEKKREITGQVFIATQGGSSVKLGSVPVVLIPTEALNTHISNHVAKCLKLKQQIDWKLAEAASALSNSHAVFATSNAKMTQMEARQTEIDNEIKTIRAPWIEAYNKKRLELDEQIRNLRIGGSTTSIRYNSREYAAWAKRAQQEYDTKKQNLEAQLNYLDTWSLGNMSVRAITNENVVNLLRERDALDVAREQAKKERQEAWKQGHELYNNCVSDMKALFLALKVESEPGPLPLSDAKPMVATDADGRYKIAANGKGSYSIAARAERSVMDATEEYYWAVPITDEPKQEINLSNINLLPYYFTKQAMRDLEKMITGNAKVAGPVSDN